MQAEYVTIDREFHRSPPYNNHVGEKISFFEMLVNPKEIFKFKPTSNIHEIVPPPIHLVVPPPYSDVGADDKRHNTESGYLSDIFQEGCIRQDEPNAASINDSSDNNNDNNNERGQMDEHTDCVEAFIVIDSDGGLSTLFPEDGGVLISPRRNEVLHEEVEPNAPEAPPDYCCVSEDSVVDEAIDEVLNIPSSTSEVEYFHERGYHRELEIATTIDDVRQPLINYAKEDYLRDQKFARDLVVTDVASSIAYVYSLVTMKQSRVMSDYAEANVGDDNTESRHKGIAPDAWSIQVEPAEQRFKEAVRELEVPFTRYLTNCTNCNGEGRKECKECHGIGKVPTRCCINSYDIYAWQNVDSRSCSCSHSKFKSCSACESGYIQCLSCKGTGKIKHYKKLTVRWRVLIDSRALCRDFKLPPELEKAIITESTVTGKVMCADSIYEGSGTHVHELNSLPVDGIREVSAHLLRRHNIDCSDGLIVEQKHRVRQMPVIKVIGENRKLYTYYVYGKNRQICAPKYPKKLFGIRWGGQ